MITIREMTINDLESVLSIENECFREPYKLSDLEYELNENPVNKMLVATDEDKVIGFIDYMITFNSSTITQIAVTSSYRRKGVATKLLNAMVESFPKDIEDKVETITLEVRASNLGAIKLYESFGFEKVVIKPKYYKDFEDAIYMVMRLI